VLIAMVVAITLAPALIAIFGSLLFRPGPARLQRALAARKRMSDSGPTTRPGPAPGSARDWRASALRLAATRPVALLITASCVAGLLIAALGLGQLRLGFPLIAGTAEHGPGGAR
jgi:uncharacterized membrane protein YdfJ with MMPL/SSD domain